MGRDERLVAVARQINANHHAEETRHLVFGRRIVAVLWREWVDRWSPEVVDRIRAHLDAYVTATWREYYNPDVYRDAGFADPWAVAREAWDHPATRAHRDEITRFGLRPLVEAGVIVAVTGRHDGARTRRAAGVDPGPQPRRPGRTSRPTTRPSSSAATSRRCRWPTCCSTSRSCARRRSTPAA